MVWTFCLKCGPFFKKWTFHYKIMDLCLWGQFFRTYRTPLATGLSSCSNVSHFAITSAERRWKICMAPLKHANGVWKIISYWQVFGSVMLVYKVCSSTAFEEHLRGYTSALYESMQIMLTIRFMYVNSKHVWLIKNFSVEINHIKILVIENNGRLLPKTF